MKNYVEELGLRFDPFEPSTSRKDFYGGGNRQDLCNQIVESAMYGENIIAVYGRLGIGKSMLATEIARSFADEAIGVLVLATLFMNSDQFVEVLAEQLDLQASDVGKEKIIEEISELAHQLDLEAKSVLIQIDDAHELSREVLLDLLKIKSVCPPNSVHIILFGENQLANMLQSILAVEQGAGLIEFELPGFASDATIDYVRFKLERAGYSKTLPMTGAALGSIHNISNGAPGTINTLASEMLEREYRVGGAGGSADDFDLDEAPANRRTGANQEPQSGRSPAFVYMIAASVLVVVFLAAIVFIQPDTQSVRSETSIEVATTNAPLVRTSTQTDQARALQPSQSPATVPTVDTPAVSILNQMSATAGQVDRQPTAAAVTEITASSADPAATILKAEPAAVSKSPAATSASSLKPSVATKPVAAASTPAVKSLSAGLSSFEQKIMASPNSNYVIQILGASSEANIQSFIETEKIAANTGYFKTNLNGKPWFVVLVADFSDRTSATAAMNALPAKAKAYGPWVRGVTEIQTAITAMQRRN
ncbi:MAG: DamX protein [Pseudohongiellaceae bacterium]|jgi:DamX protein